MAANQPAHSRIIRFVFPLPELPTITECRGKGGAGSVDGPPAVPDRADRGAGHDPARPVSRGTAPGAVTLPSAVRA